MIGFGGIFLSGCTATLTPGGSIRTSYLFPSVVIDSRPAVVHKPVVVQKPVVVHKPIVVHKYEKKKRPPRPPQKRPISRPQPRKYW